MIDRFLHDDSNESFEFHFRIYRLLVMPERSLQMQLVAISWTRPKWELPQPTTPCVSDEAHQFLDKQLGDEASRYCLDAFGLIAKEGRKYGLTICLSTQRPRDIPEDVLSQMGTLIVHRMINDRDREVVERASGDIDRSAAAFLPNLGPGEAVIIGVDIPVPLAVQIDRPNAEPQSRGPDYQKHWAVEQEQ